MNKIMAIQAFAADAAHESNVVMKKLTDATKTIFSPGLIATIEKTVT